jgi:hypothetical protein
VSDDRIDRILDILDVGLQTHPVEPEGLTDDEAANPMAVIAMGLAAHARGEPVNQAKMEDAATLVTAAQLVRSGLAFDVVERMFHDRPHVFRFTYDGDTDELGVSVDWTDEEP